MAGWGETTQAGETVIDLGPYLKARQVQAQGIDLVAAWERRRVQLLEEADGIAGEVTAAGEALAGAVRVFQAAQAGTMARLQQIHAQIEDIDLAIAHWRAAEARGEG